MGGVGKKEGVYEEMVRRWYDLFVEVSRVWLVKRSTKSIEAVAMHE